MQELLYEFVCGKLDEILVQDPSGPSIFESQSGIWLSETSVYILVEATGCLAVLQISLDALRYRLRGSIL